MTHRILVVDDEPDITALVAYHLAKAGFRVSTAANGPDALKSARDERPDIVILDLMLPGVSGYDVLAELRKREETKDVGVILLTARREETDRIRGLSLGADDYLTKPFEPRELLLRVSNVLRRGGAAPATGEVRMGNFVFHIGRGELKCGNETVRLTERERELLRYFAQRPGMPVSRHELARDDGENGGERAVDVQINRLRRKIEKDPANPVYLQTVRGKGYILYPE
jgi:two-component system phosphate regulon response regulator OmpR